MVVLVVSWYLVVWCPWYLVVGGGASSVAPGEPGTGDPLVYQSGPMIGWSAGDSGNSGNSGSGAPGGRIGT